MTDIMHIKIPLDIVARINKHIDQKIIDLDKQDYSHRLAGEISHGEQTSLDPDHPDLFVLKNIYISASRAFYEQFYQNRKREEADKPKININDMWYNVYGEGDYNPLHNHATAAKMGLSSFLFLKLPKLQNDTSNVVGGRGAIGQNDGKTFFSYGIDAQDDFYNWKYQSGFSPDLTVGDMFIFPKWLQHMVYPYRGQGERRTLAANVNVWV